MIGIFCKREKIGENWFQSLSEEFGEDKVFLYPNISAAQKEQVQFMACWKAPKSLLYEFKNLQVIQSLGAGVDHIFDSDNVVPGAKIARIIDPQLSKDMFEFTLSVILNDMKRLNVYRDSQHSKIWKERSYRSISDVTIGVMGLGVIGKEVSTSFANMGYQTLGWSRGSKDLPQVSSYFGESGLKEFLPKLDYLINLLPLTKETRGIINKELLAQLKPDAHVVNVGRGPHLVDADLLKALDEEKLGGASLDVFHEEPLIKEHQFWTHPKIFITPHIASITNIDTARAQVVENIRRMEAGKELINVVSVENGY